MKKIIYVSFLCAIIFSACKKQGLAPVVDTPLSAAYLANIEGYLSHQLSIADYNNINLTQYHISKQKMNWYTRVGFKSKSLVSDFVLLQTDSLGNASDGKIVHLEKTVTGNTDSDKAVNTSASYNGNIEIISLDRTTVIHSAIKNGFIEAWHPNIFSNNTRESSLPYPYDDLPEVVVVGYLPVVNEGSNFSFADYILMQSFFSSGSGGGGGSDGGVGGGSAANGGVGGTAGYDAGYGIYTSLDNGNGGSNDQSTQYLVPTDLPDIAVIPDNSYLRPAIDMEAWMKCFTDIPDAGAICTVTLLGDLPIDTDPSIGLNIWSGNTGHCFLQLTKTNGSQSVTQIIGFTAEHPAQAIVNTDAFVAGKTVDNAGHKYDCSITMNLTAYGLNTVIDKMKNLSASMPYSVVNYDCLDYGLEVFNSARPNNPLIIPKVYSTTDPFSNIATGPKLYTVLETMVATGSPESANISISGPMHAGVSHGPCN